MFTHEKWQYKNLTATGSVTNGPGHLLGYQVNDGSTGSIALRDGGASGTIIHGAYTAPVGFNALPVTFDRTLGLYATIVGTVDVTFLFTPAD